MSEDAVARDMGMTALRAWGSLVCVLVETLDQAEVPPSLIHGILDRLHGANAALNEGSAQDFLAGMLGQAQRLISRTT